MVKINPETQLDTASVSLSSKLWIYTNYDCNLSCSYCVAKSHPKAPRHAIALSTVKRIVDEAVELGFKTIFFTGGEPFILDNIYEMLLYSSTKLPTTILTNAMLFHGRRLKELVEINNENISIQVSLDGSRPEHHDPYRGQGTWQKTINGIHKLIELGFRLRLSTTETPANARFIDEICEYCRSFGTSKNDHIVRPLAKRGFSDEGLDVGRHNLIPEMTVNSQGVYWHPLSTDSDLRVSADIFPLAGSISKIKVELEKLANTNNTVREEFQ